MDWSFAFDGLEIANWIFINHSSLDATSISKHKIRKLYDVATQFIECN